MTSRALIIAEAGVNHNGELGRALQLVSVARDAGADAVKFQHFRASKIVASGTTTADYQLANTGARDQLELLSKLELDLEAFARIAEHCRAIGITFLCTPFDIDAAADLVALGMPLIKIPSGELTNAPMLCAYAQLGLPILLSTGMGTMDEVELALDTLRASGANDVTLLQCTSLYPAPPATLNLGAMVAMRERFGVPTGFSDHSLGDHAAIAAVALGATVIEKHFTLDCNLPGPDHKASLEPGDFCRMVQRIRDVEAMLGDGIKRPSEAEKDTAALVRRSWHAARDLAAGSVIREGDVVLLRPASGIAATETLSGRRLLRAIAAGAPIRGVDLAVA